MGRRRCGRPPLGPSGHVKASPAPCSITRHYAYSIYEVVRLTCHDKIRGSWHFGYCDLTATSVGKSRILALKFVPEYRSELIKIAAHALENVGRRSSELGTASSRPIARARGGNHSDFRYQQVLLEWIAPVCFYSR